MSRLLLGLITEYNVPNHQAWRLSAWASGAALTDCRPAKVPSPCFLFTALNGFIFRAVLVANVTSGFLFPFRIEIVAAGFLMFYFSGFI